MKIIKGYEEVDINKLTPDPNQPRKNFSEEVINTIAATMTSNLREGKVGVVNSIEVDESYMIITGEQRLRAAKQAGLTVVPVKVIQIDPDERYFRQVAENLARGNMAPLELSDAFLEILKKMGWKPSKPGLLEERFKSDDKYVVQLSKKIGRTKQWVYQILALQDEKPEVKEYLRRKEAKYSLVRDINQSDLPQEIKEKMKNKVIAKEPTLVEKETVRELIRAIKWAPEKTKELLEESYNESRAAKNIIKIDRIAPEPEVGEKESNLGKNIVKHLMRLSILLEELDVTKMRSSDKQKTIEVATNIIHRLSEIIRLLKGDSQNLPNPQNEISD